MSSEPNNNPPTPVRRAEPARSYAGDGSGPSAERGAPFLPQVSQAPMRFGLPFPNNNVNA